jgi:hypothetical protein
MVVAGNHGEPERELPPLAVLPHAVAIAVDIAGVFQDLPCFFRIIGPPVRLRDLVVPLGLGRGQDAGPR